MKIIKLISSSLLILLFSCQQHSEELKNSNRTAEDTNSFDPQLAQKYKADEYGMRLYTVCFFNPGPSQILEKSEYDSLQQEHYKYISQLSSQGVLVLTGFFMPQKMHESFLVFTVDEEEARAFVSNDPKVKKGLVVPEFLKWYSSAGLVGLKDIHEKISRKKM